MEHRQNVVWKLIVNHQIIVSATETSNKMAVNALSKNEFKRFWLIVKKLKFYTFRTIRFGSNFASMWSKYVSNNVWRNFRLVVFAFATVARESLKANLLQKLIIRSGILGTITEADIGSLKSLHTLLAIIWYKYLDLMLVKFEQNRMIPNIQNFEPFGKKWLTIYVKVLTPFWKRSLWHKQLFNA